MDIILDEIRKGIEQRLEMHRGQVRFNETWLNVSTSVEPLPSRYDEVQVYLLLQILDKLSSIDDGLIVMNNDSLHGYHSK